MMSYFSDFRRQRVHQFKNFNNSVQFVYNKYQKKNQIKNFILSNKSEKLNCNIFSVINHVPSFKNFQKPKTKQVWIPKTVFDSLTCSLAPKSIWVPKFYL